MLTKPAHIHVKEGAVPHVQHTPIPVPLHWKGQVNAALDHLVKKGITRVAIGTPTTWWSQMVITAKKDTTPSRRTVNLQHLNNQCLRETPLSISFSIGMPSMTEQLQNSTRHDGYHAMALDKESQPLTTFITEWGCYMYLHLPQGYLASGGTYTWIYDEVIKNVPRKLKIVDDTLLYDINTEDSFFHTWAYLYLCAIAGIVINDKKFKFCGDTVEFVGLKLTPTGIAPSDHILWAIKNFPKPTDLTNARSWFGLVNQIVWAYSTSPIMEPFWELVKHNVTFQWNSTLDQFSQQSKELLISKVKEGITTFDINRPTCLQTDWSKTGTAYLLLEKYCSCSNDHAPVCCSDGWRLVFAGSCFLAPTESHYSLTEGEALGVAWPLENARMFVLRCQNLIVSMDHKRLLGIFDNGEISNIPNPPICSLKEKTLHYTFTMTYCPGKWCRGADAVSRNPTHSPSDSTISTHQNASDIDIAYAERINDQLHQKTTSHIQALEQWDNNPHPDINNHTISTKLEQECTSDPTYQLLASTIENIHDNN